MAQGRMCLALPTAEPGGVVKQFVSHPHPQPIPQTLKNENCLDPEATKQMGESRTQNCPDTVITRRQK